MTSKEWREFVEWMHSAEVRAVVAKYAPAEAKAAEQMALWEAEP